MMALGIVEDIKDCLATFNGTGLTLDFKSDEELAGLEALDEPHGYLYCVGELQQPFSASTGRFGIYFKVGSSGNLKERLANLQTGNPRPLKVVEYWKVTDMDVAKAEDAVHRHHASQEYKAELGGGTEWYRVTSDECWKAFNKQILLARVHLQVFGPPNSWQQHPQKYSQSVPPGDSIYVIEEAARTCGYYKVGRSDDPSKRVKALQTGNPRPLRVVKSWQVTDMDAAERAAHGAIVSFKLENGGGKEWYCVTSQQWEKFIHDIVQAIRQYTSRATGSSGLLTQFGASPTF